MSTTGAEDAVDVLEDIKQLTSPLIRHLLSRVEDMDRESLASLRADGEAAIRQGGEQFVARRKVASARLRLRLRQLGFDFATKGVDGLATIAGHAHAAVVPIAKQRRRRMELRWAELLVAGYAHLAGGGGSALARAVATINRDRATPDVLADIVVVERAFLARILGHLREQSPSYFAEIRRDANRARDRHGERFSAELAEGVNAVTARLSLLDLDPSTKECERLAVIAGSAHAAPLVANIGQRLRMTFRWAALLAESYPGFAATAAESVVRAHAREVVTGYQVRRHGRALRRRKRI